MGFSVRHLPMASDCRYGASEESRVRGTWSRRENAARTAPRYLCVAHSWKIFSGMLLRILGVGSLLLLRRWHILLRAGVSSVHTWRTSAPRLVSSVLHTPLWATRSDASVPSSEGLGRGFDGSGTGSPTTLLIGHIRSGIRLYTCQRGQTAYELDLTALRQSSGLGSQNLPGLRTGKNLVCGYILGPWWRTVH